MFILVKPPGARGPLTFSDDFNRADEDPATGWTEFADAIRHNIEVISNEAASSHATEYAMARFDEQLGGDHYAEFEVTNLDSQFGPIVGADVTNSEGYVIIRVATTIRLYKVSGSSIGSAFVNNIQTPAWAVNDVVRLEKRDRLLTMLVNGDVAGGFWDTGTTYDETYAGMMLFNSTVRGDNFQCGNLVPYDNVLDDFSGTLSNWTVNEGSFNITATDTVEGATAVTDNHMIWAGAGGPSTDDQFAEVTITNLVIGNDIGPICRAHATADTYYSAEAATNQCRLFKVLAGVRTVLGTSGVDAEVGDVIRIEANGTTIRMLRNGVEVVSQTDSDITTGTIGLWTYNTASEAKWFRGGDL